MIQKLFQYYQIYRSFESDYHQRMVWQDQAQARIARDRAEAQAQSQFDEMIAANPSGVLGQSSLNDAKALVRSGLLPSE